MVIIVLDESIKKELLSMEDVTPIYRKLSSEAIENDELLNDIIKLLDEKDFRYRWSATKVLDLISLRKPEKLSGIADKLFELFENDKITVVRNSALIVLLKLSKYTPEAVSKLADKMFDHINSRNVQHRYDSITFIQNVLKVRPELKEKFLQTLRERQKIEENPVIQLKIKEALRSAEKL